MRELKRINQDLELVMEKRQDNQVIKRQMDNCNGELERLHQQLNDLNIQLIYEKKDVENLRSMTFSNFFYTLTGQKDERLRKEEQELLEVKAKLDHIQYNIEEGSRRLKSLQAKYVNQEVLNQQYEQLYQEKLEFVKYNLPQVWAKINENLTRIEEKSLESKEVKEAYDAGLTAVAEVSRILESLESAKDWGTFDMFGGGVIATMAKREHMNNAQQNLHRFQRTLKLFNTELNDVAEMAAFELEIDGFLSMADYWMDGFFVDWAVQERIISARDQVLQLKDKISSVIRRLNDEMARLKEEVQQLKNSNEQLVTKDI
jgi:DNA repair exonuclease SbcCD ATPase subunit